MSPASSTQLWPLRCPECGETADPHDFSTYLGCPSCLLQTGVPVNFVPVRPTNLEEVDFKEISLRSRDLGIWKWAPLLSVDAADPVTLGEGGTPLIRSERLGETFGLNNLYIKNEAANPTWSHKDRLCAAAVTAAKALGADTVVGASTGNHGASLAAYAARAGLHCVIATLVSVPETMKTLMRAYGAELIIVEQSAERFDHMSRGIVEQGWYPCTNGGRPPIGSTPYGIDAYKTIAFELWEQLGYEAPDFVVVPVGYADCIAGIVSGFQDLVAAGEIQEVPRVIAAEPFDTLAHAMAMEPLRLEPSPVVPTPAFSIGGAFTTHQAVSAVKASNGFTISVDEDAFMETQQLLANQEGLYAEAASCVAVAAAQIARQRGLIGHNDKVVVVSTSTGLKDPESTKARFAVSAPQRREVLAGTDTK